MKHSLDSQSREALVKYRLQRALDTLEDAKSELHRGSYNSCMNRLYYSCFYAVLAILIHRGVEAKSHAGVRGQFSLQIIKPGLLDKKFNTFYYQVFQSRIQGDYDDFFTTDQEIAERFVEEGEVFIKALQELIENIPPIELQAEI